ncbi:MAG: hypothetical protein IMW97_04970 [Firmicutes bacterium]|nr:hypothetical protein [Candidatus Fermentithermobacillaceae bacterium]
MMRVLYWKIRISLRSVTSTRLRAFLFSLGVLVSIIVAVVVFFVSRRVFSVILGAAASGEVAGAGSLWAGGLLSVGFLFALVMSLFTALGVAFSTLYSSSDLPLLFAAPLGVREVFLVKFAEIALRASIPALILTFPLLAGYGAALSASPVFYLQCALLTTISILLPTALGAGLNLLAVRLIPPYRVKELGAALGTLFGAAIYALMHVGPRHLTGMSMEQALRALQGFRLSAAGISPAWWLAQAAVAASKGDFGAYSGWAGLTLSVSGGLMVVCFSLVTEAFYGGWVASGEVHERRGRSRARERLVGLSGPEQGLAGEAAGTFGRTKDAGSVRRFIGRAFPYRSPVVVALARKELRQVCRDLREISNGVYMLVMMVVALVGSARGGGQWLRELGQGVPLYGSLAATFLMSWGLSSSFGVGAVAREGKNWPLLRSTPVTGREIVRGKTLGILLLVLPIAMISGGAFCLFTGGTLWQLIATLCFVVLVVPAMVSIEVSAGAVAPNFEAEDPKQRASGPAFLLGVLLELLYAGLVALGVFLSVSNWLRYWNQPLADSGTAWIIMGVLGLAIVAGASVAAFWIMPEMVGRSLDEREAVEQTSGTGAGHKGRGNAAAGPNGGRKP